MTDDQTPTAEQDSAPRRRRWAGITSIALSLIGLTCTILAYHVFEEPPASSRSTITIDLGFMEWKRESATPPPSPNIGQWVTPFQMRLVAISFAALAVVMSVVSWCRHEGTWLGLIACTFAAAAVAWVWFIVVFAFLLMSGGLFALAPSGKNHVARADT